VSVDGLQNFPAARHPALGTGGLGRQASRAFKLGERFELTVLERVGNRRYRVQLGDSQREVRSTAELTPGTRLQVQIAAASSPLLLQGVDNAAAVSLQEAVDDAEQASLLGQLALQHAVILDSQQRGVLEQSMRSVDEPTAMAEAGLFLGKLGLTLDATAMQAIYQAQVWPSTGAGSAVEMSRTASRARPNRSSSSADAAPAAEKGAQADSDEIDALAQCLQQQLSAATGESAGEREGRDGRQQRHALAQELLNTHDEGSVGYRYGVLPLLIADQFVELDLVRFNSPGRTSQPGLQRLTMTLNSTALGRIEVDVRALGARLDLKIRAASETSSAALAGYADEVRALVARLGWNVEALAYGHDAQLPRAATHLVHHVLRAHTLSRLL
jgi:hypothetical protein